MFVNAKVFAKLVYFTEMLFIEYPDKYLSVRFLFNNHDIDKSDIQEHLWITYAVCYHMNKR